MAKGIHVVPLPDIREIIRSLKRGTAEWIKVDAASAFVFL